MRQLPSAVCCRCMLVMICHSKLERVKISAYYTKIFAAVVRISVRTTSLLGCLSKLFRVPSLYTPYVLRTLQEIDTLKLRNVILQKGLTGTFRKATRRTTMQLNILVKSFTLHPYSKSARRKTQPAHVAHVQLPASLDQALSAPRLNKLQLRALCELQQQEAEAALGLKQQALQLQQKEAEIEFLRTDMMLRDRTSKLLFSRGLLSVKGVLEWLEEEHAPKYGLQTNQKTEIWQAILADPVHKRLVTCLVRATSKQRQKDKLLHLDIRDTYVRASKKSPYNHNRSGTVIDIGDGPFLPQEAQIMVCICKHFRFPYKYHPIQKSLT